MPIASAGSRGSLEEPEAVEDEPLCRTTLGHGRAFFYPHPHLATRRRRGLSRHLFGDAMDETMDVVTSLRIVASVKWPVTRTRTAP